MWPTVSPALLAIVYAATGHLLKKAACAVVVSLQKGKKRLRLSASIKRSQVSYRAAQSLQFAFHLTGKSKPFFSKMVNLQAPDTSKRDQFRAGTEAAARGTAGEEAPVLPHHASFPETAAELILDLTVEGRNAGVAPVDVLVMLLSHTSSRQSIAPAPSSACNQVQ